MRTIIAGYRAAPRKLPMYTVPAGLKAVCRLENIGMKVTAEVIITLVMEGVIIKEQIL